MTALRAARRAAREALAPTGPGEGLTRGGRPFLLAVCAGVVPLLLSLATGVDGHRLGGALILLPVWVMLLRQGRDRAAAVVVLLAYAAHSLLAIAVVAADPATGAAVLLDGEAYARRSLDWIRSGWNPEHLPENWLPAHLQEALGMTTFAFTSLGLVTLMHGFYQIDLMNCYVGHLLRESQHPLVALFAGWHLWALVRGVAYTRLAAAAGLLALRQLCGARAAVTGLGRRFLVGGLLLLADAVLKWTLLEPVRRVLSDNLVR